jgi:type II secretory pathway predicted ATPase ExeA
VLRDEVRNELRPYMARTGWSAGEIAQLAGLARQTVLQFVSNARFGNHDRVGNATALRLRQVMRDNPPPLPERPEGTLYETESTAKLRALIRHGERGGHGIGYGPAGAQKTFLLRCYAAEAARDPEPSMVYIRCSPSGMTPSVLLQRIGRALGAPYAQYTDGVRRSVVFALMRRQSPVAIVLDEAQHLYKFIDTLETLREIGDLSGGKAGIIVVGNEMVEQIFEPRRGSSFEQWRSRIQQKRVKVLGPSREESRQIIKAELGAASEQAIEGLLDKATEEDPLTGKKYISARRLFDAIKGIIDRRKRGCVQ